MKTENLRGQKANYSEVEMADAASLKEETVLNNYSKISKHENDQIFLDYITKN